MCAPCEVTSATAQFGPIGVCEFVGQKYVSETACAADASPVSTLPAFGAATTADGR
jgi:hypothetical protein